MLSLKLLGQKYPAVHALHGDVPFLTNPAETHVHWLMLVDAAGDVESKGHELLVASPGQYTPATHGKHILLAGGECVPGAQIISAVLFGHAYPALQGLQFPSAMYMYPSMQLVHNVGFSVLVELFAHCAQPAKLLAPLGDVYDNGQDISCPPPGQYMEPPQTAQPASNRTSFRNIALSVEFNILSYTCSSSMYARAVLDPGYISGVPSPATPM